MLQILNLVLKKILITLPSFVRRPSDVLDIREILEQENNDNITIFPKIENQEGIDNIEEILEVSDGLMVARGDMGVEIPLNLCQSFKKI